MLEGSRASAPNASPRMSIVGQRSSLSEDCCKMVIFDHAEDAFAAMTRWVDTTEVVRPVHHAALRDRVVRPGATIR
jgi:hypothetical protein